MNQQPSARALYSIYPDRKTRVAVHVLFWCGIYLFNLLITYPSLHAQIFERLTLVYCFFPWLGAMVMHYYFCARTLPNIYQRRWAWVLPDLVLIYFVNFICSNYVCAAVATHLFPGDTRAAIIYDRFWVHPMFPFFSIRGLLLRGIIIIWIGIPAALIKLAIGQLESIRQQAIMQAQKQAMEISFLRAQIQPHFLFNSLNSIYGLVLENEAASNSVLQLSDLLRFSLYDSSREYVTLREELHFLENYLLLEQQRHKPGVVSIRYDFSPIENPEQHIRPLLLINFIEHAFRYGVNARTTGAWASMTLWEKDGHLHFSIRNNAVTQDDAQRTDGLQNVQRRLELEYPGRYELHIEETQEEHQVQLAIQL